MYVDDEFTLSLAAARRNVNMTRKQVANTVGVSEQTISNWEQCKTAPDARFVKSLSDLYHVPASILRFEP